MSTVELKQILISHLRTIEDETILNKIKEILLPDTNKEFVYVINEDQSQLLSEARQEIERGEMTEEDEFFKELDEWLKEKE